MVRSDYVAFLKNQKIISVLHKKLELVHVNLSPDWYGKNTLIILYVVYYFG